MSSQDIVSTTNKPATASTSTTAVSTAKAGRPVYKSNIPPPPPQQILEEDEYIEALSKIIERDFFPDLAKLKRQHAYLDAVEMNDIQRIEAAAKELAGNDTPWARTPKYAQSGLPNAPWTPARVDFEEATPSWGDSIKSGNRPRVGEAETPFVDETPLASTLGKKRSTSDSAPATNTIDTSLTLDQFQARYTSEDNASFNEIIEKINARKKDKYHWMYDQEKKSMRLIEQGHNPEQKLLRASGEVDNEAPESTLKTGDQGDSSILEVMLRDKRSGVIPTWEYKAKNSLMYFPEGLGTSLDEKSLRGNPKEIVHKNTSFQGRDLLVVNQTAAAKIDPAPYLKGNTTDSPKVAGYGFVSSTPSPSMSQMGDDPEMMTWGTIEDEPLLISSGIDATDSSPFKLPPTPRRELIAQKLTEKASKSFRQGSSLRAKVFTTPSASALSVYHNALGGTTPTPRFNSPYHAVSSSPSRTPTRTPVSRSARMASPNPRARAEMLSPAGKSLLLKARGSINHSTDYQLRSSYGSSSSTDRSVHGATPVTPSPLTRQQ
ncbi:DiGeorge syndrome critical region protein 14 [Haplosporangium sp. Z 767]|nr:DiGeorge syndrome critical region protein 14 [Haplosporangium sp. Z 11]KAF9187532.1 DiGeorge syndrome critical region protein 14 [Haplosporangium sp. Z 767]